MMMMMKAKINYTTFRVASL